MCDPFGFLLYIIMLSMLHLSLLSILSKHNYFLICLAFLFITLIASFRGTAGVDTYLYILRFDHLQPFENIPLIEPLIPLLMSIVKFFNGNFGDFSILYGLILSVLYFYIFKKIPGAIYFGLVMFPVLYIDSLFNGIRIGLAYPLIFLAIARTSIIFFLFAIESHISALLGSFFKIIPFKYLLIIVIIVILGIEFLNISIYDILNQRYYVKLLKYQEMHPSHIYSGLADSFLLFISIAIYYISKGVNGKKLIKKLIISFIVISMIHIFLTSQYVFMLRVIRLLAFLVFAFIASQSHRIYKRAVFIALIFGILYSLNFLRQINSTCSYEIGGFIPLNFDFF